MKISRKNLERILIFLSLGCAIIFLPALSSAYNRYSNGAAGSALVGIRDITISPNKNSAEIRWQTDLPSDSTVFYTDRDAINIYSNFVTYVGESSLATNHRIMVPNLLPGTIYKVVIRSKTVDGEEARSETFEFTTLEKTKDNMPARPTQVTISADSDALHINWKTRENSTARIYYSASPSLDIHTDTGFIEIHENANEHSVIIPNLSSGTPYYLAIQTKDEMGNFYTSGILSAVTDVK